MDLQKLFHPKSIAIVGVSHNPRKVGYLVAKNIIEQGYTGELYFINPSGKEILGKKTYPNIQAIKKKIDLTILAIPADASLNYLEHIKSVGCRNIVLFAAGFKENNDAEGAHREHELISKINALELTLLGPNCLGFINTGLGINATFLKTPSPAGNIGFISQSGALGSVMVDNFSAHKNLGFSYFVSLGNKTNIDESDSLEYMSTKDNTAVIGMYLEGVQHGNKFRATLQEVTKRKPVIILKSGATDAGSKAALSHTGGLVGDDAAFEAICEQSGAIRAHTFSEFLTLLKIYSFQRIPVDKNILVLSNAGGVGVLLADYLVQNKLSLTTVSDKTKERLVNAFDEFKKITVHNPIDLLGDASAFDYEKAVKETMKEKDVGAVIVLLTTQANTEIEKTAQVLIEAQKKLKDKPIYPVFMGEKSVKKAHTLFEEAKMASFLRYDDLPFALAKMIRVHAYNKNEKQFALDDTPAIQMMIHKPDIETLLLKNEGKPYLNQYDSLSILHYLTIPVVSTYLAHNEKDLQNIAKEVGYPLVAKIASDKVTHKTEVKGVVTGITNYDELVKAFHYISTVSGEESCYVQQKVSGHELFIGGKKDPTFGPVVIIGFGGVYAELVRDIVQCVYPFSYDYFVEALGKTKIMKLTEGFRNTPPINIKKLYEVVISIGMLLDQVSGIQEIDINPLMISGSECKVVDARIIL